MEIAHLKDAHNKWWNKKNTLHEHRSEEPDRDLKSNDNHLVVILSEQTIVRRVFNHSFLFRYSKNEHINQKQLKWQKTVGELELHKKEFKWKKNNHENEW